MSASDAERTWEYGDVDQCPKERKPIFFIKGSLRVTAVTYEWLPADREEAPVHEPGDEDRPRDEADEVAGGAEEDGLEEAPG